MGLKEWVPYLFCGAKAPGKKIDKTFFLFNPFIPLFHYSTVPITINGILPEVSQSRVLPARALYACIIILASATKADCG